MAGWPIEKHMTHEKQKILTIVNSGVFGKLSPIIVIAISPLPEEAIAEIIETLTLVITILKRDSDGIALLEKLNFDDSPFASLLTK